MKLIPLTHSKFAQVDDEDWEWLMQWKWHVNSRGYAIRTDYSQGKRDILMHREILNTPTNMDTDHINMNRLDNQRHNLRVCDRSGNLKNRGKQSNNTSGYKGVTWSKWNNKWMVQIIDNKKRINIGYYKNIIDAAKAYDGAAKQYHGEFAQLNFPETQ